MLWASVTVNCLSSYLRIVKKGTILQMASTELIHHILSCDLCGLKGWCLSKWLWNMHSAKKHPPVGSASATALKLVCTTYAFLSSVSIVRVKILWEFNVFGDFIINEINLYLNNCFICHPVKGRQTCFWLTNIFHIICWWFTGKGNIKLKKSEFTLECFTDG